MVRLKVKLRAWNFYLMNTLGDRIKILRGNRPQKWLAEQLGIPPTTLSNYENNKSELNFAIIQSLKRIFQVNTDWLLFGTGSMFTTDKVTTVRATAGCLRAGDPIATFVAQADPSPEEPPRVQVDESLKQLTVANERLWQMMERERELMKELGELKAENARLKERVAAREQAYLDMRDFYRMQEEDVGVDGTGAEENFAGIAPLKTSTTR